jgi:hypothetical protein
MSGVDYHQEGQQGKTRALERTQQEQGGHEINGRRLLVVSWLAEVPKFAYHPDPWYIINLF